MQYVSLCSDFFLEEKQEWPLRTLATEESANNLLTLNSAMGHALT